MSIRARFRKRWLGQMGYAGGDPELVGQPIILTTQDRLENSQTQRGALRDKVYSMGKKPPKRKR